MTAIEEMQVISRKEIMILDVAERLFATKGFEGTSVRDIAREVGMSVSMISYYFGSKEKLMEAIVLKRLGSVKLRLEHLLEDYTMSSLDKIYMVVDSTINDIVERQYFQKIMIREQCGKSDTTTGHLIEENRKDIGELIEKLIQEGQRKGEFKEDVDIVLLMMTLIGTTNYVISAENYYKDKYNMHHTGKSEFHNYIKKHVGAYIKNIFKHVLCYELL